MAEVMSRPCPVCGELGADLIDNGPPRVVCCRTCEMVFNDVAEDVDYSGSKYSTENDDRNSDRYDKTAERISLLPGFKKDWTILDVGCGSGGLMQAFELGVDYWDGVFEGIDPSPECARKAQAGVGTLLDVKSRWDCIVMCHVLEHIRDTKAAMRKLEEVADSVYVEVPNGLRYCQHVKSPYQHWNREHVNHFSLECLVHLFQAHNFQLRACGEYDCEPDNFPAVWAWFTRRGSLRQTQSLYGDRSAQLVLGIKQKIKAIKGPVIAWGIGALARRIEPLLADRMKYAFDSNPQQSHYCKQPILYPNEWSSAVTGSECSILITTILHKDEVLADIRRLGLKNEVITLGD